MQRELETEIVLQKEIGIERRIRREGRRRLRQHIVFMRVKGISQRMERDRRRIWKES